MRLDLEETSGQDGFTLRTEGERLIIAGGKPRGTLYGVYALLEEKLGVRWFSPDLEVTPHTNRLELAALNETQMPALEYREVFWSEMLHDADFAARHRLNGNHYNLTDKHGGRFAVYFPFVHSLDSLIPPELFKEHPEYFPLINGERKSGYVQRCLSNPEVLKLAKSRVRQWIKDHPEASIISVSQNDTGNWCHCEQCKALDDAGRQPRRLAPALRQCRSPGHRRRLPKRAHRHPRLPIHPQAAQDPAPTPERHHPPLLD